MERVLPEHDSPLLLRTVDGEVVIYEQVAGGTRPSTAVRAKVLPDGELLEFEPRFARS